MNSTCHSARMTLRRTPAWWILRIGLTLFLVIGFWMAFAPDTSVYAQDSYHVVQPGENLSSIARRYGVSVSALQSYNGIANANLLRVGQRLRIPSGSSAPVAPPSTPRVYTSSSTSVTPVTPIPPQITKSEPVPTATSSALRVYIVRAGDTLSGIAVRYGVSISALKARNGLRSDLLYIGQRLIVP